MAVGAKNAHEFDNDQLCLYIRNFKRLHRFQAKIFLRFRRIRGRKGELRSREFFRRAGAKNSVGLQKEKRTDNNVKKIINAFLFIFFLSVLCSAASTASTAGVRNAAVP